ncbi:MAG: bifunctional folylpolyglutamate synthase/dihydrofolate synthase [Spirochaetota bacterium]
MSRHFSHTDDAFAYIESFTNLERSKTMTREYRLERMEALLEAFGRPERELEAIHIAGSKGKGSTAAFVASMLDAAGYDVGLYTSPHVESYLERFTSARRPLPEHVLLEEAQRIHDYLEGGGESRFEHETHGGPPTTFELLTLLAFLAFVRLGYRYAVLETGMGGRLDATNVVSPRASIITPIEREHTEYLGETIPEIAGEKAAIIKSAPAFIGRLTEEAVAVVRRRLAETGAEAAFLTEETTTLQLDTAGVPPLLQVAFRDGVSLKARLSMLGGAQADNAALAALCVHRLFPEVAPATLERGIQAAWLPGRGELIRTADDVPVVLDGAHTPHSVARLRDTFGELFGTRGILIFGSVAGKDHETMARILADGFDRVIIARPGSFKDSSPEAVAAAFESAGAAVTLIPDARAAVAAARAGGEGRPILVTGSFYLVGEVRRHIRASMDAGEADFV